MKTMKTNCQECKKEFIYTDLRNVPVTCGDRICKTNYEYRKAHKSYGDGLMPDPEEIKKWHG